MRVVVMWLALPLLVACDSDPGPGGGGGSDPAGGSSPECDRYLVCVSAVDPAGVEAAESSYGETGSCWQDEGDEACSQHCSDGLASLAAANPGTPECPDRVTIIAGLSGNSAAGQTTYDSVCGTSNCHGPNGDDGASNAGDLPQTIPVHPKEEVIAIVVDGTGEMASLAYLSDQQIADVVTYVKGRWP